MDLKTTVLISSLFLFGVLEQLFPFFAFEQNLSKRITTNILLGLFNVAVTSVTTALLLKWVWQHPNPQGLFNGVESPWWVFGLAFVVLDFYMYWWHRVMHNTAIGWRFHHVHHTEQAMNVSTAYRFHTIEVLTSNISKIGLIWLCGIPPVCLLVYEACYSVELIFHHSNWELSYRLDRLLSYLIVTPNFHRLHHSEALRDSRSNYASFLSIWDQLFRSRRYPRQPKSIRLGLKEATKSELINMLLLPF